MSENVTTFQILWIVCGLISTFCYAATLLLYHPSAKSDFRPDQWAFVLSWVPVLNFITCAASVWCVLATASDKRKREEEELRQETDRIAKEEAYRRDEPRRQEEQRRREAEQRDAAQRALAVRLADFVSASGRNAADLKQLVQAAENAVDVAEHEFKDGVFAPFWDAVEQSANQLAQCEATIQQLINISTIYNDDARKLATPPPPLQLTLPDASHTANRMQSVVRRAQKDFHFATIYEQRKTNQLLVAGFSSLGQAINELGYRLDSSSERLASSLSRGFSELTAEQERSREQAASDAAAQREQDRKLGEQAASDAADQRKQDARADRAQGERDRRVDKKLDNVQRGRKPFP